MRVWLKVVLWVGAVVATLLVGLASWENLSAVAPAADPAKRHDVRIVRDSYGVPHIFGRTDADVAYGLAYAHAEDDFPNLEEVLAATRGRAAAISGEEGAQLDFALGFLDARRAANAGYLTHLDQPTRDLVEAYAAGLNRYAAKHPGEIRLRNLFPVTGRDVVAGFVLRAPFFFGLERTLGALVEGKLPPRDSGAEVEKGSNGFAIAGRRSADGVTRLISNSHQPWTGGVAWYEVVVHSDAGWDFAGALFPGAPYPLLGHNKTLGWTNTVNRPDLVDTYRLVMDADGTHYRYDGKWLPLQTQRVWLHVKLGPLTLPIPRTLYRSVQGPVIRNKLGTFAVRYTGIADVQQVEQYYRLNKARNFAEWRQVMAMQGVPATNFVYADAAGHIGMFYNARFPARTPGFDWKGVLPGDTSRDVWTTYVPFASDPAVIDPPSGWVANSNNTPLHATAPEDDLKAAAFAPELGIETFMTNRATRWIELFGKLPGPISRDDLLRIKFDKTYAHAGTIGTWIDQLIHVDTKGDASLEAARALLAEWDWTQDGRGAADALAATVIGSAARSIYRGDPLPDPHATLTEDAAWLRTHFGRIDPPLGAVQRIVRGKLSIPVYGGPDTMRAIYSTPADGVRVADHGDSFIMLVEWGKDGAVHSQSIHQFGAATSRPESPHYADQARLFAAERWKPVWFDEKALTGHIERSYEP
ncbi:acylase [Sphingosinicellaceae bacterium]|nr:acylase [Sphingosinicellaceae bacterium]